MKISDLVAVEKLELCVVGSLSPTSKDDEPDLKFRLGVFMVSC